MKKTFAKYIGVLILSLMAAGTSFAVSIPRKVQRGQEAWRALKRAQNYFESNDFGNAIKYAENAKEIRKQDASWQIYTLENTLRKTRVRNAGDSLDRVMPVLKELELSDALDIIRQHSEKMGMDYFTNSYSKFFEFVSDYESYPEADYLLGKIYRLEGEFSVAQEYMLSAYNKSRYLDVPMEKYDLLYDLAALSKDLSLENDYETYLLAIISDNERYNEKSFTDAVLKSINNNKKSIKKFFELYRCESDLGLSALVNLVSFYLEKEESSKALRYAAIATVISVTKIDSVLKQRISDYTYSSFEDMLVKCSSYDDIIKWGNDNRIWELYCNFAKICATSGKVIFALDLYDILSRAEPEVYWKNYATKQLENYATK